VSNGPSLVTADSNRGRSAILGKHAVCRPAIA
jgi:hypothetical protein